MIATVRRLALAALVLAVPAIAAAQTYTLSPPPFLLAQTNAGAIINASCIWTYSAGTTTPATTYTTSTGTANSNPIRSDSAGRFTAYLSPGLSYKFVYESACTPPAHGTVLRTADNIGAVPTSASTVDVTGTAGEAISAGLCVYLSDGSGSKNAGQWYKCDSANTYSSTTNWVGIAPSAISAAATGTIRLAGTVSGLSSLNIGSIYYAGTAGALTSTAPTNARKVGQADTATTLVLVGNPPPPGAGSTFVSPTFATSIVGPFTLGCGIRLTLTSGTPVTTADVTAAATIYATPYATGGWGAGTCAFYDGSAAWTEITFTETSIALGTITSALPYDVFCYNNSGTMACEILAWTSATARATALVLQNGILVKTGATTRRYIGTFYTTSTTTTEDSAAKRFLWNYYNRDRRPFKVATIDANYAYTTATWRQANATATYQVDMVIGWAEATLDLTATASINNGTGNPAAGISLGEDSTSSPLSTVTGGMTLAGTTTQELAAHLVRKPAVGRHVYVGLEYSAAAGSTGWYYGNALLAGTIAGGLTGWIEG